MKHIAIIAHHWLGDVIGGSFRLSTEYAKHLAEAGHQVSYICCSSKSGSQRPTQETEDGVEISRFPFPASKTPWGRINHYRIASRAKTEEVNRGKPIDIVFGHSPVEYFGANQASGVQNTDRIYYVHSPFDDELKSQRTGLLQRILGIPYASVARRIEANNIRRSRLVCVASKYTKNSITAKYPWLKESKIVVLPGSVDTNFFNPTQSKETLRRSLGHPWLIECPHFLTVRRLEPRMGIDTLIDACHILHQKNLNFRLLIGGTGSQESALKTQADSLGLGEKILFLGRIPEDCLAAYYAAADCFVLPTKALECFGLIVLEAFASGIPVIGSTAAAIPELVSLQQGEWSFPPSQPVPLAKIMETFLHQPKFDPHLLRKIAESYSKNVIFRQWDSAVIETKN